MSLFKILSVADFVQLWTSSLSRSGDFGWHSSRSNIISSSEAMKPAVLFGNTLNHRTILHLLMSDM